MPRKREPIQPRVPSYEEETLARLVAEYETARARAVVTPTTDPERPRVERERYGAEQALAAALKRRGSGFVCAGHNYGVAPAGREGGLELTRNPAPKVDTTELFGYASGGPREPRRAQQRSPSRTPRRHY